MCVLVACNYEEDPIKNMKALEWSQHYSLFFRHSRKANFEVREGILPKFKLIQAFMVGFVICKNEEDPSKMKALDAQGQLTSQSKV